MKIVVCQRRPENLEMTRRAVQAISAERAKEIHFFWHSDDVIEMAERSEDDEPFFVVSGQSLESMYGHELAVRLKDRNFRNQHYIFSVMGVPQHHGIDGIIPYRSERGGGYEVLAQILTMPIDEMTPENIMKKFPGVMPA